MTFILKVPTGCPAVWALSELNGREKSTQSFLKDGEEHTGCPEHNFSFCSFFPHDKFLLTGKK